MRRSWCSPIRTAPCTQGEAWRPTTVDIVLGNKEVTLRAPGRGHPVVKRAPTAADMFDKRAGYFLNFPGNPNIPRCTYDRDGKRFARGKPSIAYAHIVAQRADPNAPGDEGRLSLQYWFFYYFNDFNDKHEADWENIKLFFPVGTVEAALQTPPESAGYAQHEGGEYADWDSDKVEKVGTHPVVYSAVGSHASYYSSSLWLGLTSTEGFGCDDTRGPGHDVRLGAVLLPARAESRTSPFAWVNYEGRWGQKLPGANNGPTGPNMKPSWSAPFEWQEGLRGRSVHLPAGETLGQSISGAFCGTVAALSSVLNYFYDSPRWTILAVVLVLVTILALVIWLVRRSTWARAAAHPIRADRTIGQMLFASGKIYWKRRWLFLSLGLLAIVVFAAVRGFEELLQLAFSPLGDVTIRFGATALAALVVNGAVAIALDRLDRDRQVTVLRASGRMLRRVLPLLGAIVLEAIVVVLIVLTVIGIPLLLGLLVEELGLAVLVVLIIIAVWWLARRVAGLGVHLTGGVRRWLLGPRRPPQVEEPREGQLVALGNPARDSLRHRHCHRPDHRLRSPLYDFARSTSDRPDRLGDLCALAALRRDRRDVVVLRPPGAPQASCRPSGGGRDQRTKSGCHSVGEHEHPVAATRCLGAVLGDAGNLVPSLPGRRRRLTSSPDRR